MPRAPGDGARGAAPDSPGIGDDAGARANPHDGAGDRVTLRVTADLADVSLDLPPPFGKTKGTARTLGIESRIGSTERVTGIRYGDLAGAVLRLVPDGDRSRIERGEIRLGATPAALPDAPGVTVRGALATLDTGAWSALDADVSSAFFDDDAARDAPLETAWEVSIDTASLTALGARFPDTRIRAARGAGGAWRLDLAGPRLEGEIRIPAGPGAGPVTADFEHAVFERVSEEPSDEQVSGEPPDERRSGEPPDELGSGEPLDERRSGEPLDERRRLDPRTLPALSFSARRFVFDGIDLGHVTFATVPSEHGMRLERLHVPAGSFEGIATGDWSLVDGEHRTGFEMVVYGDDLGRMLGALGYDDSTVDGGATDVAMRGSWAGTPADFALGRLNGAMRLRSGEGRLRRLRRGITGRVFGLLTITSLPRRLILDFSDFFRSGFEYDRIEGSFVIERGNAHTTDLFMDSDTARFEVVGRTGLVNEDYDKIVTVIPKLSSILLLTPIGLAQKIFNTEGFDESFAYRYTITGTWDEPVIEPIRTRLPENETQGQN